MAVDDDVMDADEEQGDKEGARAEFNKALELQPDFIFAKNNLEELDK